MTSQKQKAVFTALLLVLGGAAFGATGEWQRFSSSARFSSCTPELGFATESLQIAFSSSVQRAALRVSASSRARRKSR